MLVKPYTPKPVNPLKYASFDAWETNAPAYKLMQAVGIAIPSVLAGHDTKPVLSKRALDPKPLEFLRL